MIVLCAVGAGAAMATGATCLFFIVTLGEPAEFVLSFAPVMAMAGGVLGLVSACYLGPLLMETRLRVSLPIVLGGSGVVAIGAGTLHPLLGAIAGLMVQVALACAFFAARPSSPRKASQCLYCGHDCLGVVADVCPECGLRGPDWAARNPGLCACCGKGTVESGRCGACGAVDFNAGDWRRLLERKG